MARAKSKALRVAQAWVESYAASAHSTRAYGAHFNRFYEWLLEKRLTLENVSARQIEKYLTAYAEGMERATEIPRPRSATSVVHARSVLRRLFQALIDAKIRIDNPVNSLPTVGKSKTSGEVFSRNIFWAKNRLDILGQVDITEGLRDSLLRSAFIADWTFWLGLFPSELAAAKMLDIEHTEEGWVLGVHRFGHGQRQWISVPEPAMKLLAHYRVSRGLEPTPQKGEDIPLVSNLKAEKPIGPWSISQSLRTLEVGDRVRDKAKPSGLSSRLMRSEFINRGLLIGLPAQHLLAHARKTDLELTHKARPTNATRSAIQRFAQDVTS